MNFETKRNVKRTFLYISKQSHRRGVLIWWINPSLPWLPRAIIRTLTFSPAARLVLLQPVMWAGIAMMTVVAGAFLYFRWWTKAALAAAVGVSLILLAQTLPDHGAAILLGGLGLFALVALLILYSYYKGQLDRNHDGIPGFLQKTRPQQVLLGTKGESPEPTGCPVPS